MNLLEWVQRTERMKANFQTEIGRLITDIRDEFGITQFIETGTNVGQTAEWASENFDRVITIELDGDLYAQATEKRGHIENIEFVKGLSQEELKRIVPELDSTAIVHLDAHCGGKWASSAGESLERTDLTACPLMEELDILGTSDFDHYIFIDDARVFTSPRREPFDMDEWPNIQEIVHKIEDINPEYHVIIFMDEIIAVPPAGVEFVREWIRSVKSVPRTRVNRFRFWIMNKVWKYASLSGPTRDF